MAEAPADAVHAVAARYARVLAGRLVDAAGRMIEEAPELSEQTGFTRTWSMVELLPPGVLGEAVLQPMLDAWVRTLEGLLEIGAHIRYPAAHPARHLKSFARLALSWKHRAPDGAEGRVALAGHRALPLWFGRLLLVSDDPYPRGWLLWKVREGVFSLQAPAGRPIVQLACDTAEHEPARSGWRVHELPRPHGILIDAWSWARDGSAEQADEGALLRELSRALGELPARAVDTVRRTIGTVVPAGAAAPAWTAGLACMDRSGNTGPGLLELAHRDRLARAFTLEPLVEAVDGSGLTMPLAVWRGRLIDAGARAAAAAELGAAATGDLVQRWGALAAPLRSHPRGRALLQALFHFAGEDRRAPSARADPSGVAPPGRVDVRECLRSAELPTSPVVTVLRKTRRASGDEMDWGLLDALRGVSAEALSRLVEVTAPLALQSETAAVCATLSCYVLGRFDACRRLALSCLAFDPDVEEYWFLLAFSERHLGRRDAFERICFDACRDVSVSAAPAPISPDGCAP